MGPTWVLSAPDGPQVGPMNLALRGTLIYCFSWYLLDGRWHQADGLESCMFTNNTSRGQVCKLSVLKIFGSVAVNHNSWYLRSVSLIRFYIDPSTNTKTPPVWSVRWKLFINSQISTRQPLKVGNEQVITSHTLLGIWLLINARS